ncbi:MAG: PEP-CTERM sorting domain-containing protein [Proteobacteria bacterium]|nr:PEP-CTERM sorting domain-containing protein [Pseudomonadota bacterium]
MARFQASAKATIAAAIAALASSAGATNLLVITGPGDLGYGYGYSNWTNFTSAINGAVAGSGGSVTTATSVGTDALGYDAVMLDQRWTGGTLSADEMTNLSSFIATGKKLFMVGENSAWTTWDTQILSLVGGTFTGEASGPAAALVANQITAGVPSINLNAAGTSIGGTPLYAPGFAALWTGGQSVLTVLDVNVFDQSNGNLQFENNVASWLVSSVPEPGTYALLAAGLGVIAWAARRRVVKA